jgi:hypothetical protein
MSIMTEAQIAEKPITVATDEAISNLTDSRQRRLAVCFRRWNNIARSGELDAPGIVAADLSRDSRSTMG